MGDLYVTLKRDLKKIGIKDGFELVLKPYSKSYYGRYDPNTNRVIVYVYEDSSRIHPFPYKELLLTAVHECCHYIQWNTDGFVRVRGVMHDIEFLKLYNYYSDMASALCLIREVSEGDSIFS